MTDGRRDSYVDVAHVLRQLEQPKPLLNMLSEHVVFQDTDHVILWANEAAARSVDTDAEHLEGRQCYTVYANRDEPCPSCPVEAALQSGEMQEGEMHTPDGKAWLVRAMPLRDEDGIVVGAVETTLEVTEQKRTVRALHETGERFGKLFDLIPDTVFLLDEDGVFESVNTLTVTDYNREDILGRHFSEAPFLTGESRQTTVQLFKRRRRGDAVSPFTIPVSTKDGDVRYAQINAVQLPDGDILGIARDVTEHRREEQRVRATAEEMRVISDMAMELNRCDTIREICSLVGDTVRTFNDDAYVIVTAPDGPSSDIRIQHLAGFSPVAERLSQILGVDPRRMTFSPADMTEEERRLFTSGRLIEMPGGLYALSTRKIPKPVCTAIEGFLDVDAIYTMGFAIDHTPLGGVIILPLAGTPLRHGEAIEAIVRQAAAVIEQRLAQEALQKSEAHSRALLNAVPDLMFQFDADGTIIAYEGARADLYRDPDDFMGKNIRDVVPADLAEATLTHIQRAHASGEMQRYEYKLPVHGEPRRFEARMAPVDDASVVALIRDVTERKRTEEALRRSEKKFRLIAENTSDYISIINWKGEYQYVSPSHRQLGYKPEDLLGQSGLPMVHPADREKLLPLLKKYASMKLRDALGLYRDGVTERFSFRFSDAEGRWHHVDTTADLVKSPEGDGLQILLVSRDVTRRTQLLEELKESEERFRTVFEHAMVGIYKTTPDGRILMANPTMVKMLGYDSFEQLAQRNLEREGFEPSYDRDRFKREIEETGTVTGLESSWKKQDGTTLHVRENARAIRDDSGETRYYLGTVEDITDRKRAEEQVAQLNDMLQLINKIMRHDIINHLNVAQSLLELYEDERDISLCDKARSRMLQGMQLIKRMRELESLVGAGGRLQPYDIRDVVEEAIADCPIKCSIQGQGTALADDAIYPAVDNIVRNAVEHADADSLHVSITDVDGAVELSIADDGMGIPDALKEKVFEERYSHGGTAGSGLGLYIVRQTVERYGGSIRVEDNEPQGTVFVIHLQAATGKSS